MTAGPTCSRLLTRHLVLWAGVWLFSLGAASAAQEVSYVGRPVVALRLEAEGREVSDTELAALVETRVGSPLSMAQVRETIVRLMALDRFENVRVDATSTPDGVALRYDLVPLRTVSDLVFLGTLGLHAGQLRTVVVNQFTASPRATRAPDIARTLVDFYRDRGYPGARVASRVEAAQRSGRVTLVFDINAGTRARIGTIDTRSSDPGGGAADLGRLKLRRGEPYDWDRVQQEVSAYADSLRASGHYEARVDVTPRFSADGRTVDLVLSIDRGSHVTVKFRGDPLPANRLAELVPIQREGSVDQDLLEDASTNIRQYLQAEGHRDAKVDFTREQQDNELTVVFDVQSGMHYRVSSIQLADHPSFPTADLQGLLRTQDGQVFVQATLDTDVAMVEAAYRRRGFQSVRVQPVVTPKPAAVAGEASVSIRLQVTEGPRTLVGSVDLEGARAVSPGVLRPSIGLTQGAPYDESRVHADADAILLQYLNRGYQAATVRPEVEFNPDRTRAAVRFLIQEGPQVLVGHILIVGNTRTSTATIEREMTIRPGEPLGLNSLAESQRRLGSLGLFRRVRVTTLQHGADARRDLLVVVEEAPSTTLGYGGGLEGGRRLGTGDSGETVERFEFAPRGFFEIGRRNLWGKNRSVNVFTRVSVRRNDSRGTAATSPSQGTGLGFREYRLLATYREPQALGSIGDIVLTGFLEQAVRSSFDFARRGVRVALAHRITPRLSVSSGYAIDRTRLFNEQFNDADRLLIDRLFPQVRLSAVSASVIHDSRDDKIDPANGSLVSVDGEMAARRIGSEVGFAKTYVQGFMYRRVPGGNRLVFACGARLGLASGFARTVAQVDSEGNPVVATVRDVPASERFFAGGDTTVRGFALDRLGASDTLDRDGVPKGGHALLIVNSEFRMPVWRALGAVVFLDLGNVFANVSDLDPAGLRGAAGFGVRYRSPVGPIRFDLGYKLDRKRYGNGALERPFEFYISIGQAF